VLGTTATSGKRQLLVQAAADVFASHGFTATRIADIATAAGVGKGTVYEYFSSKEELFFAVFEWIDEQFRQGVDRAIAEPAAAHDQLRAMLMASAEIVSDHRELLAMNLDFWAASRGSAFEQRFTDACHSVYQKYRGIVAGVIRRGQAEGDFRRDLDADGVATLVVSALDGLGVQCWFDGAIDPQRAIGSFTDALCGGLCREERRPR
jgi:AcrR family transcriptional regulator